MAQVRACVFDIRETFVTQPFSVRCRPSVITIVTARLELMWEAASDTRACDESGAATCQWCRHRDPQRLPEPSPRREFWSDGAEHGGCRAQWPQHASSMIDLAQALQTTDPEPPPPAELQCTSVCTPVPSPWRYSGGQLPVSTSLAVHQSRPCSRVSGCSPAASSVRLTWAAVWHLALCTCTLPRGLPCASRNMHMAGAPRLHLAPAVGAIHAALHAVDSPVDPVHAGLNAAQSAAVAAVATSIAPDHTIPEPRALPLAAPGACWCPNP